MLKRIQSFNYTPEEPPPLFFSSHPLITVAPSLLCSASLPSSYWLLYLISPRFQFPWPRCTFCLLFLQTGRQNRLVRPFFSFLIFNAALTQSSQNAEKLSDLHVLHKHNKISSLKPLQGALWACTPLVLLRAKHMQSAVPWHFGKMKPPQVI